MLDETKSHFFPSFVLYEIATPRAFAYYMTHLHIFLIQYKKKEISPIEVVQCFPFQISYFCCFEIHYRFFPFGQIIKLRCKGKWNTNVVWFHCERIQWTQRWQKKMSSQNINKNVTVESNRAMPRCCILGAASITISENIRSSTLTECVYFEWFHSWNRPDAIRT